MCAEIIIIIDILFVYSLLDKTFVSKSSTLKGNTEKKTRNINKGICPQSGGEYKKHWCSLPKSIKIK